MAADGTALAGRVALVSGVARPPGIGRATALRLARAGATVACVDVVAEAAHTGVASHAAYDAIVDEVRAAGRGDVLALPLADHDPAAWAAVVEAATQAFGRLDICCNLGGATGADAGDGPLTAVSEQSWRRCVELNLTVPWLLTRAAAAAMVAGGRGGAIVHLSSYAATAPTPGAGAVGAARAAVNTMVAVLAMELAPYGIRCNAVCPLGVGPTERFPNPGLVALAEREAGSLDAWVGRRVPLGRTQDADETAAVVAFLCSDEASYLSGVAVPVAGGAPA